MHRPIFALNSNGEFQAYEYRQGGTPFKSPNDNAFIAALKTYMQQRSWGSLIGLQVPNTDKDKRLQEFIFGDNNGAIMLDSEDTEITQSCRVTGYKTDESG